MDALGHPQPEWEGLQTVIDLGKVQNHTLTKTEPGNAGKE